MRHIQARSRQTGVAAQEFEKKSCDRIEGQVQRQGRSGAGPSPRMNSESRIHDQIERRSYSCTGCRWAPSINTETGDEVSRPKQHPLKETSDPAERVGQRQRGDGEVAGFPLAQLTRPGEQHTGRDRSAEESAVIDQSPMIHPQDLRRLAEKKSQWART